MMRSMLGLTFAALLGASPPARASDGTLALVEKCVSAHGGRSALARWTALRAEGEVSSTIRAGAVGSLVRIWERPGRLRVEITYPGEPTEVRVVDGSRGWRQGMPVEGPPLDAMVLQAARLDLPYLLWERRGEVVDGGSAWLDGRPVRVLALALRPHVRITVEIDPASSRILRSSGIIDGAQGAMEFTTRYGDFRKLGGVWFAHSEETTAMGRPTGTTTLRKIERRAGLPGGTFGP